MEIIIRFLLYREDGGMPPAGFSLPDLFRPEEDDDRAAARNLASAFLILLAGPSMPGSADAKRYLERSASPAAGFLADGVGLVFREVAERYAADGAFRLSFDALYEYAVSPGAVPGSAEAGELAEAVFFPEGSFDGGMDTAVAGLREKRRVRITSLNSRPITSPGREVLFTSNILLTVPSRDSIGELDSGAEMRRALERAAGEEQVCWYDHPMPVGAGPGANEALHGLGGFAEALAFEERAGNKEPGRNVDCVCSLSVTHRGLREVGREWLASELVRSGAIRGMNLYLFAESDSYRLLEEVLLPAARRYFPERDASALEEVFGVDGAYGRHYSFLKAIARFWQVFISPEIRATFKIDLDQVFPQKELVRETGSSAFGHLRTPLWGARGADCRGNPVYLGMIAGSLVNRKEIGRSLFTPDVPFPGSTPAGDEVVFRSQAPQAVSTAAEMTARYETGGPFDGESTALQRVHVTGGTTGMLVEALARYRPFTLSRVGRAEDQAYLLSVLFDRKEGAFLRYVHVPGLVMRHDSDLFADAAGAARAGKKLGDYIRMLLFSSYARALPWPVRDIKEEVDPFTGCFISRVPITIVLLRFALRTADLFASGKAGEGLRLFTEGVRQLPDQLKSHAQAENEIRRLYEREKEGWDLYYDILDEAERGSAAGDSFAIDLVERARQCAGSARIGGE